MPSITMIKVSILLLASIITFICPLDVVALSILPPHPHKKSMLASKSPPTSVVAATSTLLIMGHVMSFPSSAFGLGDIGKGEVLFKNNCASCHIDGTNLVNVQRTLKRDALEKFGIGLDQPSIKNFVTNNMRHKNLVFFRVEGGKLNDEQWEDVTTYISDQAKGDKW